MPLAALSARFGVSAAMVEGVLAYWLRRGCVERVGGEEFPGGGVAAQTAVSGRPSACRPSACSACAARCSSASDARVWVRWRENAPDQDTLGAVT
jgi:hypothetical protein